MLYRCPIPEPWGTSAYQPAITPPPHAVGLWTGCQEIKCPYPIRELPLTSFSSYHLKVSTLPLAPIPMVPTWKFLCVYLKDT